MILISHRGNINGKEFNNENSPDYILNTLNKGYNVEVDIWYENSKWLFGHDEPIYNVDINFYLNDFYDMLWFHCKNIGSLYEFVKNKYTNIKYFWHENDKFTLTSNNYIWTYPDQKLTNKSICVLPELSNYKNETIFDCAGICSDFIYKFKNELNKKNPNL